jgi:hypothetical protein
MKKIKFLILLITVSVLTFYSCTDNSPIENEVVAKKSVALRTTLNALKESNNQAGRTTTNPFCFEFVYPISLSYNNGTIITVASLEGLIEILSNETLSLHIEGIVYPFQVQANGAVTTINTEEEFMTLIVNCNFNTFFEDLKSSYCFDLVFPITILANGTPVTINSQQELLLFGDAPGTPIAIEVVFSFSVSYNGSTVVINDYYEFYEMVNNCGDNDCVCTLEYNPVCVQTPAGIVEYGNLCFAQCDGYTQNDLVNCDPNGCWISNFSITTVGCNPSDGSISVNLNFDIDSFITATQFQVFNSSGNSIGVYDIATLPLTINVFSTSTTGLDSLTVSLVGESSCNTLTTLYTVPNCNPIADFASLLGTCFYFHYPIQVHDQRGSIVTVNSDAELLQYYFPDQAPNPDFQFLLVLFFTDDPMNAVLINSQAQFEEAIAAHCN